MAAATGAVSTRTPSRPSRTWDRGAIDGEAEPSCANLAERLDTSNQTPSRRIQLLERAGAIEREIVRAGQWIAVTADRNAARVGRTTHTPGSSRNNRRRARRDSHEWDGRGSPLRYAAGLYGSVRGRVELCVLHVDAQPRVHLRERPVPRTAVRSQGNCHPALEDEERTDWFSGAFTRDVRSPAMPTSPGSPTSRPPSSVRRSTTRPGSAVGNRPYRRPTDRHHLRQRRSLLERLGRRPIARNSSGWGRAARKLLRRDWPNDG